GECALTQLTQPRLRMEIEQRPRSRLQSGGDSLQRLLQLPILRQVIERVAEAYDSIDRRLQDEIGEPLMKKAHVNLSLRHFPLRNGEHVDGAIDSDHPVPSLRQLDGDGAGAAAKVEEGRAIHRRRLRQAEPTQGVLG